MRRTRHGQIAGVILSLATGWTAATAEAKVIDVTQSHFEESLNQAIDFAQAGDVIQMPSGRFFLSGEILIDKPGLTLRGQGADSRA